MHPLLDELIKTEFNKANQKNLLASNKPPDSTTEFWVLDYSHSKLRDLPEVNQEQLLSYELYASHNKISYINPCYQQLRLLTYIDLSHNRIVSFPSVLCEFRYLRILILSKNMLSTFPANVSKLQNLQELDFHSNQFREFPDAVCNLSGLRVLSAARNPFDFLPVSIGQIKSLSFLDLRETRLVQLPIQLQQLKELETLMLDGTPLKVPPISIASRGLPHIMAYLIHVTHGHRKLSYNPRELSERSILNAKLIERSKDTTPLSYSVPSTSQLERRLSLQTDSAHGIEGRRNSNQILKNWSGLDNPSENVNSKISQLLPHETVVYADPSSIHLIESVSILDVTHSSRLNANHLRPDSGYSTTGYLGGGESASGTRAISSAKSPVLDFSHDEERRSLNLSDHATDSQSGSSDLPIEWRASIYRSDQLPTTTRKSLEQNVLPPTSRTKRNQQATTGQNTELRLGVSTVPSNNQQRTVSRSVVNRGPGRTRTYATVKHPLSSTSQKRLVQNGQTTKTDNQTRLGVQASSPKASSWLSTDSEHSSTLLSESTNSHPVQSVSIGLRARPKTTNTTSPRRERTSPSSITRKKISALRSTQGTTLARHTETKIETSKQQGKETTQPKRSSASSISKTSVRHSTDRRIVKPVDAPPTRPAHSKIELNREQTADSRIGVSLRVQTEKARRSSVAAGKPRPTKLKLPSTDRSEYTSHWSQLNKDDMDNIMRLRKVFQTDLGIRLPVDAKLLASEVSSGLHLTDWLNHVLGPANQLQFPVSRVVSVSNPTIQNLLIKHLRRCREAMLMHGVPKDQLFTAEWLLDIDSPVGLVSLANSVLTLRSLLKPSPRSAPVTSTNFPNESATSSQQPSPRSPKFTARSVSPKSPQILRSRNPSPPSAWPHHLCSDV